jgi:type IV secretion system protein VirD4
MARYDDRWGPSHQYRPPPTRRSGWLKVFALALLAVVLLGPLLRATALGVLAVGTPLLAAPSLAERSRRRKHAGKGDAAQAGGGADAARGESAAGREGDGVLAAAVRQRALLLGGGAFLGVCRGRWALADPEHAVLVLGPPRSGKTSAVVIPTMLCASGPALCTSTKGDVMDATRRARGELGEVWLFDPAGAHDEWPDGVRRLCWTPVAAARSWDGALLTARAMAAVRGGGRGVTNESHWRERSAALLAPLLHAAALGESPIADVLRWILQQDLDPAGKALEAHRAEVANDVLLGIARTEARERSSIFSATAGVLAAYNADSARRGAAESNFDAARFVRSTDTVYVTAPAHKQALAAPLIVGLLEQIRYAAYHSHEDPAARARAREARAPGGGARGGDTRAAPVLWCLDEVANIAPIHDLPALVSEAGGQGLHVLVCLQDLSQARARWGEAAEGFLSLFQTKLVLGGIADTRTLEAISLVLGEYDRHLISHTAGRSQSHALLAPHTDSEGVSYGTQRQRVLSAGEVHRLPDGHGLVLHGTRWGLVRLQGAHRCEPWAGVVG